MLKLREVIWIPAVFLPAPEILILPVLHGKKIRKSSVIWERVDIEGTPEVLTKLAIQVTTDMGDIDVSERLNGKVMENETDNLQTFEQKVEKATGSLTIETNSGDISVDCD